MTTTALGEMWFDWAGRGLLLVAHTKKGPDAETWSAMCSALAEALKRVDEVCTLVMTDGGGPSSAQRDELARATMGKKLRVSVISGAAAVRFIASSVALFNPTIKSFQPGDWRRGLEHVATGSTNRAMLEQAVSEFAQRPHAERFAVLKQIASAPQ